MEKIEQQQQQQQNPTISGCLWYIPITKLYSRSISVSCPQCVKQWAIETKILLRKLMINNVNDYLKEKVYTFFLH